MARSRAVKRPAPGRAGSRTAKASAEVKSPAAVQADLRAMLLAKRNELIAKLREEREGRRDVAHREKIEGTPFGDRPGLSPDEEMGFAVADRRAAMLGQINLALKKMEEGNYGRCEVCEEPINVLRLRAHPFAVRCTRCQEAWERDRSRPEPGGVRARGPVEETT
ncbi:MAG: TraR/DksA C4-type zinc finger protein [Candidatus Rokubacteria bacterium]|nr:TraR/DksA C4-type zinc finger protein [Candidatus Rokubacteria bacterium]